MQILDTFLKALNDINLNKAHGYGGISIKMNKMCVGAIVTLLMNILNTALNWAVFSQLTKKGNIFPIH